MDSYGTRFQLLAAAEDFATDTGAPLAWDEEAGVLRLARTQIPRFAEVERSQALTAWSESVPLVRDRHGQLGLLSADASQLHYALKFSQWPITDSEPVRAFSEDSEAGSAADLSLEEVTAPMGTHFADLHLGGDGRAALPFTDGAGHHGLRIVHLGKRWQRSCLLIDEPKRCWVDHLNRVWLVSDSALTLCSGGPLPQAYHPRADRFEPVKVNPEPLTLRWRQLLPAGFSVLALCADEQSLYILVYNTATYEQKLLLRSLEESAQQSIDSFDLPELDFQVDAPFAIDLAVLARGRLALMLARADGDVDHPDLPVIDVPLDPQAEGAAIALHPRRYPQRVVNSQLLPRFVQGEFEITRYLAEEGPARLYPLAQARFLNEGSTCINNIIDSGEAGTVWHRLYLDACVPPGCRLNIEVKVSEDAVASGCDWQLQPSPQRQAIRSEIPFFQSELTARHPDGALYEIQLQREAGAAREICGRYLQLRISMQGDGRHSPAIAAMRVYHARFSWQQAYLPEHFHQDQLPDCSDTGAANGADIRERFLASLEGMLTPIEESIVNAECWLFPQTVPGDGLDNLAAMVGGKLPSAWPEARKRAWLAALAELRIRRGTFAGLCLALDIATDGAVGRGQVVPVENYRLRRTLATILGIDMSDDDHPLTLGTGQSGNSIVGETLILSEEESREFLALFAPEVANSRERRVVENFFDRYAHRLSIVIHNEARVHRESVQNILAEWVPAHLQWQLLETDHPFVLGLSPLLGIDTYLEHQPDWRQVVLNQTWLGREGILRNPVAFSPANARGPSA